MSDASITDRATIEPMRDLFGPAGHGARRGVVVSYDADAGLGTVAAEDGSTQAGQWLFHCTAIADGSRAIEPGTPVVFDVRAGGPGRFEAFDVTPESGSVPPTS